MSQFGHKCAGGSGCTEDNVDGSPVVRLTFRWMDALSVLFANNPHHEERRPTKKPVLECSFLQPKDNYLC
jgi:hypothetical protein